MAKGEISGGERRRGEKIGLRPEIALKTKNSENGHL